MKGFGATFEYTVGIVSRVFSNVLITQWLVSIMRRELQLNVATILFRICNRDKFKGSIEESKGWLNFLIETIARKRVHQGFFEICFDKNFEHKVSE